MKNALKVTKILVHRRKFWCETCGAKEEMTGLELATHLLTVHHLEPPMKGTKSGRLFMDSSRGQYNNTYDWVLPGEVKVTEVSTGTRE